ncbi:MAG: DEAH-box ATP-dependent RNA helicase prp22 [Chaenotheca gracillima]|nr:MAG: DEAH-box ATP-dependent RNA helicase prp22 [Chaenotheca gracillima]
MGVSMIDLQRDIIIETVRRSIRGEWKALVVDESSKKIIDNVTKEDDILNENVTNIEYIEQKRSINRETDAVYLLTPQAHVVECLVADLEQRRYRSAYLVWTSLLDPRLRNRIDSTPGAREQISGLQVLSIDFFPRESHLVTFRDPWSFPILFHPACNSLVKQHMQDISQKIVSICVSLGEYPTIRYYRPPNPTHEASVLCSHLARFVQDELDAYAQYHTDFPPPTNRPRGALFITDRTMDLASPLVHEFTYQAMAHDLLPIKEGDRVFYKTVVNAGEPHEEEKEMEIGEKDKIWVENRHQHMKDTIERLMGDFQKFIQENPHFADSTGDKATSLNAIKDMLAGLPQFQELKDAYALHLTMAQECMNIFQSRKLPDLASVEQSLATGLDEDYRKPKNLADQVVRSLDDESVVPPDRLRLILLYMLYRNGLLPADVQKLLAHAQLPPQDGEILRNLELLGARVQKPLKDTRPSPPLLFGKKQALANSGDGYALSRYDPALKSMLDEHVKGTLDQTVFPFTKPQLDAPPEGMGGVDSISQSSLRSAKPTWAKTRLTSVEPRQRILVFMAGGATYAEARSCYEVSHTTSRDVFLATSHMVSPRMFIRQVGDLSVDRRRLDIPADRPKPKPPQHIFEPEPQSTPLPAGGPPPPPSKNSAPPTAGLAAMTINSKGGGGAPNGSSNSSSATPRPPPSLQPSGAKKLEKKDKDEKKKKHHFFSSKK